MYYGVLGAMVTMCSLQLLCAVGLLFLLLGLRNDLLCAIVFLNYAC